MWHKIYDANESFRPFQRWQNYICCFVVCIHRLCAIETTAKRLEDNNGGGAARKKSIVVSVTFPEDNDAKRGMRLPRVFRFVIVSGALIMYFTWRLAAAPQAPNSTNRKTFRYFIKIVIIITACYDLLFVSLLSSRSCSSATCINISMCRLYWDFTRVPSINFHRESKRHKKRYFFITSFVYWKMRSLKYKQKGAKNRSAILCCCLSRFSGFSFFCWMFVCCMHNSNSSSYSYHRAACALCTVHC